MFFKDAVFAAKLMGMALVILCTGLQVLYHIYTVHVAFIVALTGVVTSDNLSVCNDMYSSKSSWHTGDQLTRVDRAHRTNPQWTSSVALKEHVLPGKT